MKASLETKVKRGPDSWAYIYIALGFLLQIEGSVIQMATPLKFPVNIFVFAVVGVVTFYVFLSSGWLQNKLIGWKTRYEDRYR